MEPNQLLKLSDRAVEYLNEYVAPIMAEDYIGWIIPLPRKFKSVLVVDYSKDKYWSILHKNVKKNLSKRQILKSLKFLTRKGWLDPAYLEPFEEFSPQLQINLRNVLLVPPEEGITDSLLKAPIIYDDDVSGITIGEEDESEKS